jgi:hypothetical protein
MTARRGLRVAELAAAVGVGADTIRYYEKAGLLPGPARTPAGYRIYEADAVDRLRFIQGAQRLGLKLRDIRTCWPSAIPAPARASRPRSCSVVDWSILTRRWRGWPRCENSWSPWSRHCRPRIVRHRCQEAGVRPKR